MDNNLNQEINNKIIDFRENINRISNNVNAVVKHPDYDPLNFHYSISSIYNKFEKDYLYDYKLDLTKENYLRDEICLLTLFKVSCKDVYSTLYNNLYKIDTRDPINKIIFAVLSGKSIENIKFQIGNAISVAEIDGNTLWSRLYLYFTALDASEIEIPRLKHSRSFDLIQVPLEIMLISDLKELVISEAKLIENLISSEDKLKKELETSEQPNESRNHLSDVLFEFFHLPIFHVEIEELELSQIIKYLTVDKSSNFKMTENQKKFLEVNRDIIVYFLPFLTGNKKGYESYCIINDGKKNEFKEKLALLFLGIRGMSKSTIRDYMYDRLRCKRIESKIAKRKIDFNIENPVFQNNQVFWEKIKEVTKFYN